MPSDPVVRVLLAFVSVCLVVLVAQGSGLEIGGEEEAPDPAEEVVGEPIQPRFQVEVVRSRLGAMFMRVDTATGRIWRAPVARPDEWVEVGAGSEIVGAGEPLRPGRFRVSMLRSRTAPLLVRMDQQTGRIWKAPFSGETPWEVIGEAEPEPTALAPAPEEILVPPPGPSGAPEDVSDPSILPENAGSEGD